MQKLFVAKNVVADEIGVGEIDIEMPSEGLLVLAWIWRFQIYLYEPEGWARRQIDCLVPILFQYQVIVEVAQ